MSEKVLVSTVSVGKISRIFKAIRFILISYVVSLVLIALLSAAVVYTGLPESAGPLGVRVITFFGAFLSGLMFAATVGSRGWFAGCICAVGYYVILLLLGMAVSGDAPFSLSALWMMLGSGASGAVGGMIGINTKKE